jgi:hypothetical protein
VDRPPEEKRDAEVPEKEKEEDMSKTKDKVLYCKVVMPFTRVVNGCSPETCLRSLDPPAEMFVYYRPGERTLPVPGTWGLYVYRWSGEMERPVRDMLGFYKDAEVWTGTSSGQAREARTYGGIMSARDYRNPGKLPDILSWWSVRMEVWKGKGEQMFNPCEDALLVPDLTLVERIK